MDGRGALLSRLAASLAGALLFSLAYRLGSGVWAIYFAFVPLLWAWHRSPPRTALLCGWLFGAAFWALSAPWMVRPASELMRLPVWAGLLPAAVFYAYSGFSFGLAGLACALICARLSIRRDWAYEPAFCLAAIGSLLLQEGYYPQMFPPHLAIALIGHLPAVQSMEFFGTAGPALLIYAFNAGLFLLLRSLAERRASGGSRLIWLPFAAAAGLLLANDVYGRLRIGRIDAAVARRKTTGETLKAGIVQGAVPFERRLKKEFFEENLAVYRRLSEEAVAGGAELVIWPNQTYERTLRFEASDAGFERPTVDGLPLEEILRRDLPYPVAMLLPATAKVELGMRRGRRMVRTHLVAFLKDPEHRYLGLTAKRFPSPFSEFMPGANLFPGLKRLAPNMTPVRRGPQEPLRLPGGLRLGAFVCYDAIRSASPRRLARAGSDILVLVTSDQWSGDALESEQHLNASVARALENRRFLLRAGASGISAVIDPAGRVTRRLPLDRPGVIVEDVPRMDERTVYAATGGLLYPIAALLVFALGIGAFWGRAPAGASERTSL